MIRLHFPTPANALFKISWDVFKCVYTVQESTKKHKYDDCILYLPQISLCVLTLRAPFMLSVFHLYFVDDVPFGRLSGQIHQYPVHFDPSNWINTLYCFLCSAGRNAPPPSFNLSLNFVVVVVVWCSTSHFCFLQLRSTRKACISSEFPAMYLTTLGNMQSKL